MQRLSVLLLLLLVTSCNEALEEPVDPPPPATNRVIAGTNLQFTPQDAEVIVGGTITWEFQSVGHRVIFRPRAGTPNNIAVAVSNGTEARTFATAGVFEYDCDLHDGMFGRIIVSAQ